MSVKIEVSYEHEAELIAVTERLSDLPLKVSNKAYQTGRYKRVYLQGNVPEDKADCEPLQRGYSRSNSDK